MRVFLLAVSVLSIFSAGSGTLDGESTTVNVTFSSPSDIISSSVTLKDNTEKVTEIYSTTSSESKGTTVPEHTSTSNYGTSTEAPTAPSEERTKTIADTTATVVESTTDSVTTRRVFIDVLGAFDSEEDTKKESTTTNQLETTSSPEVNEIVTNTTSKERLSDQIRAVINHYKKFGTISLPDSSIPDPMSLPNMKKTFSGLDMTFANQKVYGLSNYTIEHINTDLDKMQVYVAVFMKKMTILGNYSANMWFRKVNGPFNVTLLYVEASGAAALVRDEEGNLQASESEMDMTFMTSKVNFGNMGIMGSLLQGVAASAGPVIFDAVKPVILQEINNKVREDINKKIKTIGTKFVKSGNTPPVEVAIQEARKYVKENGYDPYTLDNYVLNYMAVNDSMINITISKLTLTGLSNFRRVGEVALSMDSGTVQMGLHLATASLRGRCKWSVSLGKVFKREGYTNFTVDYVQGRGIINQSLDVSQHPVLEDIDINVGKVKIKTRGTGAFDILLEAVVNTLPDLIRHIIVDAIELPLKFALQHLLSEINVEELLEKQLPELDKMGL